MIGKTLGHYRIEAKLGAGGMGEVYRARDTRLDRDVALKVLPAEVAAKEEQRRRFEREAKTVAALKHPNIVTIYSVEDIDGVNFITMELIEGLTLSQSIPAKGLPLERFFAIASPIADALSSAHNKGITHRDLKPANIMIDKEGRVKVLDFGLAKLFMPDYEAEGKTLVADDSVTEEGRILGTAAYMSPEQAEGMDLDHRSDIFSLGVVLYEMATGERPFKGDTAISTISAILKDTPPTVTDHNPTLPRHLARVIGRCLEKNREKRFQTARDVHNELEGLEKEVESGEFEQAAISSSSHSGSFAAAPARGHKALFGFVTVLALVAVAAVLWLVMSNRETADIGPVTTRPVTGLLGLEDAGSWSPDGSFIAYSHSASGPMDIFVVSTAGGDPIHLVESPADDVIPRWSPDNRWIAFASGRGDEAAIYIVPPLGGSMQKIVDTGFSVAGNGLYASMGSRPWSPDGRTLLFSRRDANGHTALWKLDLETRAETQLTHPETPAQDVSPSYSFAGDRILFLRMGLTGAERRTGGATTEGSALMVMPAAGGEPEEFYREETFFMLPSWGPGDRTIVYSPEEGGLWMLDYPSGRRRQLTAGSLEENAPIPSADGRILYSTFAHQTDLYLDDLNGNEERLTHHTLDNFGPRVSPDGKHVVYMSSRTGNPELWRIDLGEGREVQLTNREAVDRDAAWSPDGREIVFTSDHDGAAKVWVMSADGGAPRKLCDQPGAWSPQWAPDGSVIGFCARSGDDNALWVVDPQGGEPRDVLRGVSNFGWYLDTHRVIISTGGSRKPGEMRAVNLDTGDEVLLMSGTHRELEVAPDGTRVSYCSAISHYNMNLHVVTLEPPTSPDGLPRAVGEPAKVTHGDGKWHVHNGGWTPDSKRVIYTRDTDTGDVHILEGVYAK